MKIISKKNIKYISNISPNDSVDVLVFSDSRIDKSLSLEYGVMISRDSILSGRYCYTPLIHNEQQECISNSNYTYFIDKGIDKLLISKILNNNNTIRFKTLSVDRELNTLLINLNPELESDLDYLDSHLNSMCSKGLLEARGDYTNFLFDRYLDYEKAKSICPELMDKDGLPTSDVDLVFNSSQADRLSGFRLKEFSLFDKFAINADEFSGSELYELKVKLSKQIGLKNFVFESRSKIKSSLLSGDFTFDDVVKIKGKSRVDISDNCLTTF